VGAWIALVALSLAAVSVALVFLLRQPVDEPPPPPPQARIAEPAAERTHPDPAVAPAIREAEPSPQEVLPAEPPARPRRDLPYEIEEQVRRYEEAEDAGEKAEVLIELALSSDEPVVLEFLLEELEREPADMQEPLLDAIVQFGDRAAVPTLRAMAERTTSEERRRRLRETADYLELPTLTEIRKELENR
jgi:hypothetical protein